jgi:hypothetical protein
MLFQGIRPLTGTRYRPTEDRIAIPAIRIDGTMFRITKLRFKYIKRRHQRQKKFSRLHVLPQGTGDRAKEKRKATKKSPSFPLLQRGMKGDFSFLILSYPESRYPVLWG